MNSIIEKELRLNAVSMALQFCASENGSGYEPISFAGDFMDFINEDEGNEEVDQFITDMIEKFLERSELNTQQNTITEGNVVYLPASRNSKGQEDNEDENQK